MSRSNYNLIGILELFSLEIIGYVGNYFVSLITIKTDTDFFPVKVSEHKSTYNTIITD